MLYDSGHKIFPFPEMTGETEGLMKKHGLWTPLPLLLFYEISLIWRNFDQCDDAIPRVEEGVSRFIKQWLNEWDRSDIRTEMRKMNRSNE
jgi:hypothetical protein